ncbi:MAG: hypothetical protein ACI87O_003134 [Planctomycetota bacterium]|jgi:hypothetical protein
MQLPFSLPFILLSAATLTAVLPAIFLSSCSGPTSGQEGAESDELDALEAHYNQNSRQVVERDHFEVLDSPKLVMAKEATSLEDDENVLGVALGGEAKAYPIGALGSSELVNDVCGGIAIAASW